MSEQIQQENKMPAEVVSIKPGPIYRFEVFKLQYKHPDVLYKAVYSGSTYFPVEKYGFTKQEAVSKIVEWLKLHYKSAAELELETVEVVL